MLFVDVPSAEDLYMARMLFAEPVEIIQELRIVWFYGFEKVHTVPEKLIKTTRVNNTLVGTFPKLPCPCGVPRGTTTYDPAGYSATRSPIFIVRTPSRM